jgi:hypothetical protein
MAEYYPLIARAVSGLDDSTGETRRALYERARTALVNQLRGADPPLDEAEITRERLGLEEAIRRVEAEVDKLAQGKRSQKTASTEEAPPPAPPDHPVSVADEALRQFREVAAEAQNLGGAAAEASRSAHDVFDAVPDEQPEAVAPARDVRAPAPPSRQEPPPLALKATKPVREPPSEAAWSLPPPLEDEPYARPRRSYGRLIMIVLLLLIVGGAGGAAYWQRAALTRVVTQWRTASNPTSPQPQPQSQQQAAAPAAKPKIVDRVENGPAPNAPANAPTAAPTTAVAQKVVLYDEEADNPQGKRYVGSAIWRTETVSPGPGLAPELAIRADVEIPERHMRMTWSLRRNTDKALPASHTIEIQFTLPPDFDKGGIANVPGMLMKDQEQARGVPLAGLAVKVTDGYFLIGLSAIDVDVQRNVKLLKERDWFDIPIVYADGKRAILAMEKGVPGQRAFEEAFRAWGE